MRPLKKILFITAFLSVTYLASAQMSTNFNAGLYSSFLSSDIVSSSPGIGIELGSKASTKISKRFNLFSQFSLYGTSFTVNGYNVGIGPPPDLKTIVTHTNDNFLKIGFNYSYGVGYDILKNLLNIQVGIGVSANDIISGSNQFSYVGAVPSNPQDALNGSFSTDGAFTGAHYDAGIEYGLTYHMPKMELFLGYYKGLVAIGPFSSTANDIMLAINFRLRDKSVAKSFQNKLAK